MATCRGCGKQIVWGVTADGKKIPLDPSAPIYAFVSSVLDDAEPRVSLLPAMDRRASGPMVSHFSTCPLANRFAGKKAKEEVKP